MTSWPMIGRLTTGPADDAVVMPAATPSTGHVNAVDAPTGAMASIRRRFRLFGRR